MPKVHNPNVSSLEQNGKKIIARIRGQQDVHLLDQAFENFVTMVNEDLAEGRDIDIDIILNLRYREPDFKKN